MCKKVCICNKRPVTFTLNPEDVTKKRGYEVVAVHDGLHIEGAQRVLQKAIGYSPTTHKEVSRPIQ